MGKRMSDNNNNGEQNSKKFGPGLVLGSAFLLAFVGVWEGGKLKDGSAIVYADKLAGGLPTGCGGLTKHITDTPIVVGERWSKQKCEDEERKAIIKVQTQLEKCFVTMPPQSVFDGATSHAWNVGATATCRSQAMTAWNTANWELGCNRIAFADSGRRVWSFVTASDGSKRFVQGLANRRDAEREMCLSGINKKEHVTVTKNPEPLTAPVIDTPSDVEQSPEAKTGGIAIFGMLFGGIAAALGLNYLKK